MICKVVRHMGVSWNADAVGALRAGFVAISHMKAAEASASDTMATVSTSGPEQSGWYRRATTVIGTPTIDNLDYAYFVRCALNSGDNSFSSGVLGVNITYKISAAKG